MVDKGGWDQLCCSHAPRASSPVSLTTGLALVRCPGEVHAQGLWPLVATWAMDINTSPGYGRITDSDMFLGHSLGSDVTMALGGSPDRWH